MVYTVSYVVTGGGKQHPSGMMNQYERPIVGQTVRLGERLYEILEVKRMLPPIDDFEFLHVTIKPIPDDTPS